MNRLGASLFLPYLINRRPVKKTNTLSWVMIKCDTTSSSICVGGFFFGNYMQAKEQAANYSKGLPFTVLGFHQSPGTISKHLLKWLTGLCISEAEIPAVIQAISRAISKAVNKED